MRTTLLLLLALTLAACGTTLNTLSGWSDGDDTWGDGPGQGLYADS